VAIEGSDLQVLMQLIKEEHSRSREETLAAVKVMIQEHEASELRRVAEVIKAELHTTHDEEHKFLQTWMHRMDSMGEGFFSSLGKSIAAIIFLGFAAAALVAVGKS